jgi:hypothetical protein
MADLNARIDDLVVGDDYDIVRDIIDVPVSQNLAEAWLTIRENHWTTTVVIQKHITVDISGGGIIVDTGDGDTVGQIRFTLFGTDTILLHEFYEYSYDIQVKTNLGKIYTPESGILVAHASITADF